MGSRRDRLRSRIQTSNQIKWRMVMIDLKELKYPPPPTEDAACTYWRVKERIA